MSHEILRYYIAMFKNMNFLPNTKYGLSIDVIIIRINCFHFRKEDSNVGTQKQKAAASVSAFSECSCAEDQTSTAVGAAAVGGRAIL